MIYDIKLLPFDRWRAEFAASGKAQGDGAGWTVLAYSSRDKHLINHWAADHTTTLAGGRPIVVLDMFAHDDHMDYGAKAAAYVDAYMEGIRWVNAAKTYERVRRESCFSILIRGETRVPARAPLVPRCSPVHHRTPAPPLAAGCAFAITGVFCSRRCDGLRGTA